MSKADLEKLTAQFPGAIIASHSRHGDDTAVIRTADFPAVMTWLKGEAGFDFLVDVTAVDYLGRDLRFEVVYHLRSMQSGSRLRITLQVGQIEDGPPPEVPSMVDLWPSANWLERVHVDSWSPICPISPAHPQFARLTRPIPGLALLWDISSCPTDSI